MITTVCMNPSFDKTAIVDQLNTGRVNRVHDVRYDAGGKGINVAIVLRRLKVDVTCVGCMGEADEAAFKTMLAKDDVNLRCLVVPGKLRTNLKLLDASTRQITEFNEPGLTLTPEQQAQFMNLLRQQTEGSRYVVFSGKLPIGCPETTYQQCLHTLQGKDCVLDASGDALIYGVKEKPFLVKPNLPEMEAVMHKELRTLRSIRDAALLLISYGAQNVIVSMGKYGAMYTNGESTIFSPSLAVEAKSTVGAGDAMIGGILMGLERGENLKSAFRYGVAAGAASVMTDGTQLINVSDFERLLPKVTQQEV